MKTHIKQILDDSIKVKSEAIKDNENNIALAVKEIIRALKKNRKILFFGNGGSAADSQHLAAEFIGRFKKERKPLPALSLSTDTSILTALANDYNFNIIFSRQIEGLGNKGDIAFGISTSGNSKNVIEGIIKAKKMGLKTIALTGCGGGKLLKEADINIIVKSRTTARIQESHILIGHIICEMVEDQY